MVEIVRQGLKPSERTYTHSCRECGTIFKYFAREAKRTTDQRDGDILSIHCPICEMICHNDAHKWDKSELPRPREL